MKKALTVMTLVGMLAALPAFAAAPTGQPGDAWIQGKIETVLALNRHLAGYSLDADVNKGAVHLVGKVENDIDRDLAGQLAKGVDGVVSVKNDITIVEHSRVAVSASGEHRPFGRWVDDATTTAAVKTKLLADKNIAGTKINVDTLGDVVTLTGEVQSSEAKQLAEQIAKNTGDVKQVHNRLTVASTK
jgi:hyperosmotically inducible protein